MFRTLILLLAVAAPASASFSVTGNPAADGYTFRGASLAPGHYVRSGGGGVFSYNVYTGEFDLPSGHALNTMPNPWAQGNRILMMGGVMTPGVTANSLGWPTNPNNTPLNPASQRVISKFGVPVTGPSPLGNVYSPSTTPPAGGNGAGSHSGGNGGYGSVLISIGAGNMISANAGQLLTPTNFGGTGTSPNFNNSTVQQFFGIGSGLGFSSNGLNLVDSAGANPTYNVARYIFQVDSNGLLVSWETFLNVTLLQQYVSPVNGFGAYQVMPVGGAPWVAAVQNGVTGASSDGIAFTEPLYVPLPPTAWAAMIGISAIAWRRRAQRVR